MLTSSPNEQWDETWDFGTIRPSYGHNTGVRRYATNASGTMRVVNQGREPLQPLPAMQRPLTPPESQRHSPKYGGMARNEQSSKLQVASREEINLHDSTESEGEYYDFEDDTQEIVGTSTVKIGPQRVQEPTPGPGWQVNSRPPARTPSPSKSNIQARPQSPTKPAAHSRSGTQVTTTTTQSRYSKADSQARTSATSSTAVTPTNQSIPAFGANITPRTSSKTPQRKYDALEDILLPALDEVHP